MKQTLLIAILWPVSLLLVYAFSHRAERPAPEVKVTPAEKRLMEKRAAKLLEPERDERKQLVSGSRSQRFVGTRGEDEALAAPRAWRPGQLGQRLSEALAKGGDLLDNNLAIAEVLAGLNAGNVAEALAAFEEAPPGWRNDENFRLFLWAWGRIDGQAAVEYAFLNRDGRKVRYGGTAAMTSWASVNPLAAKGFIDSSELGGDQRRWMTDGLIRGWAENNLDGASQFVAGLADRERGHYVEILAKKRIEDQGPASAFAWAEQTANREDEGYARAVYDRVAMEAARVEPAAAAAWVERNLDSPLVTSRAIEEVTDEWAERDPEAAASYMVKHLDDERFNGRVIAEFTEEWAKTDPASAAAWVSSHMDSGKMDRQVISEVSEGWARKDPAAALDWVGSVDDVTLQQSGMASVMNQWVREDAPAAGEWLNGVKRDERHDQAVAVYANRIARETPLAALSWSMEIQEEATRERSVINSAQALYRKDADAVMEWLPESGLSERAKNAVVNPPRGDRRGGDRGRR